MFACVFLQGHLLDPGQVCMSYGVQRHIMRDLPTRILRTQLLESVTSLLITLDYIY